MIKYIDPDQNNPIWRMRTNHPVTGWSNGYVDYASIECLLLFLRTFSPDAAKIIADLPSSAISNLDHDVAFEDPNNNKEPDVDSTTGEPLEKAIELFEVLDAWRRPIRYAITEPIFDAVTGQVIFPARWELRSAGQDGVFALPFVEAHRGIDTDDVVLSGP